MSIYIRKKLEQIEIERQKWLGRIKRRSQKLTDDQRKFDVWIGDRTSQIIVQVVIGAITLIIVYNLFSSFFGRR